MCGIAGVFAYEDSAPPADREELLRVRDAMVARGPDGAGLWMSEDGRVGLAHRRLSIIDLTDAGAQPMATADGRLRITFNGEIYNYRELKRQLESRGCRFQSNCDTEVLLHLYAQRGPDMVHALQGMYAFGIWDANRRGLFLARDPFGIKPLYLSDDGKTVRFASQVKAMLRSQAVDTTPEPAGHAGFFLWGHVPEPYTLYKGVRAFPAGTSLWIDAENHRQTRQFFRISEELAAAEETVIPASREEGLEQLRSVVLDSVAKHLASDVAVGIFLSSGIDSGIITALASEASHQPLQTITLGFREYEGTLHNEVPLAEEVARHYRTSHHTRLLAKDDFINGYQHLLSAMDQPSIDGVNNYFVSKAAAESGLKVALSGTGGDELFRGYPSFTQLPRTVRALKPLARVPWVGRGIRQLSARAFKHLTSPKYAGVLEYGGSYAGAYLLRRGMFMPWELPELLDRDMARAGLAELATIPRLEESLKGVRDPLLKVAALETSWYMRNQLLRDADWASMAHSLELRLPFVDLELFRATLPLLRVVGRHPKLALAGLGRPALPRGVTSRRKTGFTTPTRQWLLGSGGSGVRDRGLRGWAKHLHPPRHGSDLRVLSLVTDAYGATGGIALYNCDFVTALCADPSVGQVVLFPRHSHPFAMPLPAKLSYRPGAAGGRLHYVVTLVRYVLSKPQVDVVICGHINLLPLAFVLHTWFRAPLVLQVFGIDAWTRTRSQIANYLAARVDLVASISRYTAERFAGWSRCDIDKIAILPNAIRQPLYGAGPKNGQLLTRYGLSGRVILMTLGRMDARERYKGFDEVLEALPTLCQSIPHVSYLVVGDGTDRSRLEAKARQLGVHDRVVFAGAIPEREKPDHYRLADAYVMPCSGEGFGFVFLEAAACGVPVVASKTDGSREALGNGRWGFVVDPQKPHELADAVKDALSAPRAVPPGLGEFAYENFQAKVHKMLGGLLDRRARWPRRSVRPRRLGSATPHP